jgi:uncharacterized protein (TIGR04141 family)
MTSKTNKVNFYLLKENIELEDVFKDYSILKQIDVKDGYVLYYNPKSIIQAPWVTEFFKTTFKYVNDEGKEYNIFNAASSQAILIRKVHFKNKSALFAICFGNGYQLLKKDAYEPRFGLITALNILGEDSLRRIDKHDISSIPKFVAEQLSKKGGQLDFGLDIELDILLGITGSLDKKDKKEKFLQKIFGTTLSGKSNLSVSTKFDIDNIDKLLKASYVAYKSKRYENKGFDWIDKIELINSKSSKYKNLISQLDKCLNDSSFDSKIWLAVPELIEWQNVQGFYFNKDRENLYDDVTRESFISSCGDELTVQKLQSTMVHALHSEGERNAYSWTAFECLYAEVGLDNELYILINTEWYKLKTDFVAEISSKYKNIIKNHSSNIQFLSYEETHGDENGYNVKMHQQIPNSVCMDAKNIVHGGKKSKIEFCDIFDKDSKSIIHIKKYSGSSVLSHLFAQGFVSAELLHNDDAFKTKVQDKIKELSGADYSFGNIDGFNIVFGIIAKPNKNDIPFFSMVNLNNIFNKIKNMKGYEASIAFIPNNAPIKKASKKGTK